MNLLSRFLPRTSFSSYEDFKQNYRLNVPVDFNFGYDVVDVYAAEVPEKTALIHYAADDTVTKYTFLDISRRSNQVAEMFRRRGVRKGDVVLMMMLERPEAWITIVALTKLGATVIPATFQLTPHDIVYRCDSAKVKYLAVADDDNIIAAVRGARAECKTVEGVFVVGDGTAEKYAGEFIDYRAEADKMPTVFMRPTGDEAAHNGDIMMIYFSSGTTGMPKMIAHNYTYPLGHITTAKYWQHVEDDGIHLTYSDSGWAKFAWGKIFGQWISGTAIVAFDTGRFHPEQLKRAINTLHLTTFCAPPTIYRFLIKEDLTDCDFSTIRHCCTAGEALNPEVYNRFKEQTGLEIYEGFGQTEGTVLIANYGWDPIKVGSTGKPAPLYDIQIVDPDGVRCEDGVVGSIVVMNAEADHPTGLFVEYKDDSAAMTKAWRQGFYDTGDTAWRDSDGYIWFEGRSDDVIKCSGYRIGPFEVESVLMTHPSVLECAVTAAPDPIRGQVVKATVVLARGWEPSDELRKELQNHVKKNTAPYKYPRILEFVSELPKTVSGKIRRAEIRRADSEK